MISNVTDRKKFLDALQEISNSFTRVEAEKDFIKDVVNNLVEEFELPKKTINKLARIYHKQNFNEETREFQELGILYQEITQTKTEQ
jgi:hypothetical protein